VHAKGSGDNFLFLMGEKEIECAYQKIEAEADELMKQDLGPLKVLSLYSSLSLQHQQHIFDQHASKMENLDVIFFLD